MRTPFAMLTLTLGLVLGACSGGDEPAPEAAEDNALKHDKGVDVENKVIRIGTLDDMSGPAAAIGRPFANGKRLLAARINTGGSGLLPEGWTVELVERDHGYNPQQSVQSYDQIRDEVLFIGTSFGTPNTLPLRPKLEEDDMIAFPASLSSQMAEHPCTPPLGAAYELEAMRAMDFIVEQAEGADNVKAGIVYQQDDYGKDGLKGFQAAAANYGIEILSEQTVSPGQSDLTAVITSLKDAGATHVLLSALPSSSGPVLGTAAKLEYAPMWVGTTGAWIDAFFNDGAPLPNAVFANYYQAGSLPYWGEERPGMSEFNAAYATHGQDMTQDLYVLISYAQGIVQIEAANRAIQNGDVTRAGYRKALTSLVDYDAGGLLRPVNLSNVPYVVTEEVRILKPDFAAKSWTEMMPFAKPGMPEEKPGQDAMDDEANAAHPPGEGAGE